MREPLLGKAPPTRLVAFRPLAEGSAGPREASPDLLGDPAAHCDAGSATSLGIQTPLLGPPGASHRPDPTGPRATQGPGGSGERSSGGEKEEARGKGGGRKAKLPLRKIRGLGP
ncbi:unnamed protein product [Prorocentrum cordatum]|uniref:Uncharacterized protein n=1 Tax=Prorocentrum cordatum TaxID=2364126 RepID=A0ABN9UC17_9DINO|nr:unnamed protein product [Polarella glacialis]